MLPLRRTISSLKRLARTGWAALPLAAAISLGLAPLSARQAQACPFCAAVSLTFCEEIAGADAAVIAKLVKPAPPPSADNPGDIGKAQFEVVDLLKGDKSLAAGKKFEAIYFGDSPVGTLMLITGVDPANINWSTPIAITPKAREYLGKALLLPAEGGDRMAFFQDYLEDSDELLARDAYDEFAKASYPVLKEFKGRIHHDKLIGWIQNPKITPSRRRLYLTLVGICGQRPDADLLETMIRSNDRQVKSGLDALIASYLTLKGPEGMPLIEDLFLKKQDADYTETYAAIMALRFHGQDEQVVPRPRLLQALHYMLDRPQLADLVIADLARWQDWEIMDRLVALFKNATDDTSWVRVPVINYLQACPLPKAKEHLAELAKIDPDAVKKATNLFPVGGGSRGKATAAPAGEKDDSGDKPAAEKDDAAKKKSAAVNDADAGSVASDESPASDEPNALDESDETDPAESTDQGLAIAPGKFSRAAVLDPTATAPAIGASRLLSWLALAGCVLGVSFWAILGGPKA